MAVEVGPSQTCKVAGLVGAVVSQEEDGVADNVFVGVLDANVGVCGGDVLVGVVLEALLGVVGKDDEGGRSLGDC